MAAFLATLVLGGWRLGEDPSEALLLTASGAAFAAVVLGQAANAFACRSGNWPAWRLPRRNPLVATAVVVELVALLVFLYSPIAGVLDHAGPTLAGGLLAAAAAPSVLLADALHKRRLRRRRGVSRR